MQPLFLLPKKVQHILKNIPTRFPILQSSRGIPLQSPALAKAILAVYSAHIKRCIYTTGSAVRSALTDTIDVSTFTGKVVETYIGFIWEDGKNVATSLYTGQLTVS